VPLDNLLPQIGSTQQELAFLKDNEDGNTNEVLQKSHIQQAYMVVVMHRLANMCIHTYIIALAQWGGLQLWLAYYALDNFT
jgi:hypothetical protein